MKSSEDFSKDVIKTDNQESNWDNIQKNSFKYLAITDIILNRFLEKSLSFP